MNKYVKLAKRINNDKRGFLIVNPYLGKHVAMNPTAILKMFDDVATLTPYGMIPDKTLVIGFAETATALGLHYAIKNNTYFIQTTRENISKNRLYFSEEHSHATEQYIVKDYLDDAIYDTDIAINRIIFIDDEITTGNTVLNAIKAIENAYHKTFKYDVISVLNSMNDEQKKLFYDKQIGIHFINYVNNSDYENEMQSFVPNGKCNRLFDITSEYTGDIYETTHCTYDTRLLVRGKDCGHDYNAITDELVKKYKDKKMDNVLVLGTEEFMYAGLMFAKKLNDELYIHVKFHATTRSPIAVDDRESYPLHESCELRSVYDKDRITYVYDLGQYDEVFIVTEAEYLNKAGLDTLVKALGNQNINVIAI